MSFASMCRQAPRAAAVAVVGTVVVVVATVVVVVAVVVAAAAVAVAAVVAASVQSAVVETTSPRVKTGSPDEVVEDREPARTRSGARDLYAHRYPAGLPRHTRQGGIRVRRAHRSARRRVAG